MLHPGFFVNAGPFAIADLAQAVGAELPPGADGSRLISDVLPLSEAGPGDLSFLDNRKYLTQLERTRAGFVLVQPPYAARVPSASVALITPAPYRSFALALQRFYPDAMLPKAAIGTSGHAIDPSARLEDGVIVEPGAVIGPEAEIGRGTRIAAGAVIGYRVAIGRNGYVGANATVVHCLAGDRVIIHAGACIGQDGFGFAMGREGHLKVPQIGRVVIQDDVEIGANTTIDRGALKDTIIGEGSKIDNLVQIGHNVVMGRHCVIVAHTGISGSTELGDYVVMGGQSGTVGHIKIGTGAQVAGASHPKDDIPPGVAVGGTPARPLKQWARELAALSRLGARKGGGASGTSDD
jgi:UDP-3-O-[3-hydroxymyristoyl] glucosamine N-acyltransferase